MLLVNHLVADSLNLQTKENSANYHVNHSFPLMLKPIMSASFRQVLPVFNKV